MTTLGSERDLIARRFLDQLENILLSQEQKSIYIYTGINILPMNFCANAGKIVLSITGSILTASTVFFDV